MKKKHVTIGGITLIFKEGATYGDLLKIASFCQDICFKHWKEKTK